jgi:hypothetical protein
MTNLQTLIHEYNKSVMVRVEAAYRQAYATYLKTEALPNEERTMEWEWFTHDLNKAINEWERRLPLEATARIRREVDNERSKKENES